MAKINIYFNDLSERAQEELWLEVAEQLERRIREEAKEQPASEAENVKHEIIDDYINTHNFANEFII